MENWLHHLLDWLPEGKTYLGLILIISLFESLPIFGLLVPGSSLVVLAGFLTVQGKGAFIPLIAACTLGAIMGDIISYWLGARIGPQLMRKKSFRKRRPLLKRAEAFFSQHGGKSLFFARFLGPLRGIVPFVAGGARMRPAPFLSYTLISSILWGISYPGIGYLGGASWHYAQNLSTRFGLLIALALAVTVIHILFNNKSK